MLDLRGVRLIESFSLEQQKLTLYFEDYKEFGNNFVIQTKFEKGMSLEEVVRRFRSMADILEGRK